MHPGHRAYSVDLDTAVCDRVLRSAGLRDAVTLHEGDSRDYLPSLTESLVDVALLDGGDDPSLTPEEFDPPAKFGPDRIGQRKALDGVIHRMRSGVQWIHLPEEFGDDAGVHRTFQRWVKRGVIGRLWALLVEGCHELGGVDWQWQSFDCAMNKARHGGIKRGDQVGPNPTDRAKNGTRRGVLTGADGGPVAGVVRGANVHDSLLLQDAPEAGVVEPPDPREHEQHLCLDNAFDGAPSEATAKVFGYEPHIRRIGEEKNDATGRKSKKARRWVVERTIAWLNRCRGILIRYEKKAENYLAAVQLACALLWYRRLHRLTT